MDNTKKGCLVICYTISASANGGPPAPQKLNPKFQKAIFPVKIGLFGVIFLFIGVIFRFIGDIFRFIGVIFRFIGVISK